MAIPGDGLPMINQTRLIADCSHLHNFELSASATSCLFAAYHPLEGGTFFHSTGGYLSYPEGTQFIRLMKKYMQAPLVRS